MQKEGEERALGNSEATEVLTRVAVIGAKLLKDKWYAWQGSNLRPSVPETDALVQLSYRRTLCFQHLSGTTAYHFPSRGVYMVSITIVSVPVE